MLFEQEETQNMDVVISNVNDAADKATASIEAVLNALPAGQMNNTRDALGRARGSVASARVEQGSTLKNLIGSPMRKLIKIFTNVQIMLGSIGNAFTTAYGTLKDLGAQVKGDEAAKEQPLEVLINQYTSGEAAVPGMPNLDDFKSAIVSKLDPPEGLFGGVGQTFSKILDAIPGIDRGGKDVGFGLTQDQFLEDLMALPMKDLDGFYAKANEALTQAIQPDESDPIQSLNYDLESAGIDPEILTDEEKGLEVAQEELEGAAEVEEGEEGYLITPQDLRSIKAAMDAAKSKKKSQAKAMGGAINALIGHPIFVESISYNIHEAKMILHAHNMLEKTYDKPHKNFIHESIETETEYTEDDMIRYRLMKLAKLF